MFPADHETSTDIRDHHLEPRDFSSASVMKLLVFPALCSLATATFKIGTLVIPDEPVHSRSLPGTPIVLSPSIENIRAELGRRSSMTSNSLRGSYDGRTPLSPDDSLPPTPGLLTTALSEQHFRQQVETIATGYINVLKESEALEKELQWVTDEEASVSKRLEEPQASQTIYDKEARFLSKLRDRRQVITSILDQNLVTMQSLIRDARTFDIDLEEEVKEVMEMNSENDSTSCPASQASSAWNSPRNSLGIPTNCPSGELLSPQSSGGFGNPTGHRAAPLSPDSYNGDKIHETPVNQLPPHPLPPLFHGVHFDAQTPPAAASAIFNRLPVELPRPSMFRQASFTHGRFRAPQQRRASARSDPGFRGIDTRLFDSEDENVLVEELVQGFRHVPQLQSPRPGQISGETSNGVRRRDPQRPPVPHRPTSSGQNSAETSPRDKQTGSGSAGDQEAPQNTRPVYRQLLFDNQPPRPPVGRWRPLIIPTNN